MKKRLIMGSALLVLASSTYATESRLLALGMNEVDNDGMYNIEDSRNIFLNPAMINNYANQIMLEYGGTGKASPPAQARATLNSSDTPKAQGGFLKKYDNYVYGAYLGNESNTSAMLRIVGTSSYSAAGAVGAARGLIGDTGTGHMLQTADNQIDLFFGGSNTYKWGVDLVFAQGKDETAGVDSKDSSLALKGGLVGDGWDAHLNVSLASKSSSSDTAGFNLTNHPAPHPANDPTDFPTVVQAATTLSQEFKGKLGVQVGGSYLLNEVRLFGYFKTYGWDQTDSAPTLAGIGGQQGTVKGDFTSYHVGVAKNMKAGDNGMIYSSLAVRSTNVNLNFTTKSEINNFTVPLTIGYEAKALDWLTIRGSVVQNVYGIKDNKNIEGTNVVARAVIKSAFGTNGKATIANSTAVNAGATLTFGSLSIDGLVGTTGTAGAADTKTGTLSTSNLLTKAGLTYKF